MGRKPSLAVISAGAIGAADFLGLIQIHAIDYDLPVPATGILLVLGVALLLFAFYRWWWPPISDLPSTLPSFEKNKFLRRHPGYIFTEKQLEVQVGPVGGTRRDARFTWRVTIRNTGSGSLREVRIPIVGEIAVQGSELDARSHSPQGTIPVEVEVVRENRHSPIIIYPLPYAGLDPGATATIEYSLSWPVIAHLVSDRWILNLVDMEVGGVFTLALRYPTDRTQSATARCINGRRGFERERVLGQLTAGFVDRVELTYVREAHDRFVIVKTDGMVQ